jgi:phosphoribosyl-dephospho-CoA transferase
MFKINATARLKATRVSASVPNKIKKDVMTCLTSAGAMVDRKDDAVFLIHNKSGAEVQKILESDGWKYEPKYREFEKSGEEYTLSMTTSGSATKLEFTYMG